MVLLASGPRAKRQPVALPGIPALRY